MRKLLYLMILLLFLNIANAYYFVPIKKDVRIIVHYNNSYNDYVTLYSIQVLNYSGFTCQPDNSYLPAIIPPNSTYDIILNCRFTKQGTYNVTATLFFLANGRYPTDSVNIIVYASNYSYYVTVNGYYVDARAINLYTVHQGDIIKIYYRSNKFIGQELSKLKLVTYETINNQTFIILRAVKTGIERVYLPNMDYITFVILPPTKYNNVIGYYQQLQSMYHQIAQESYQLQNLVSMIKKSGTSNYDKIYNLVIKIEADISRIEDEYSNLNKLISSKYMSCNTQLNWYKQNYELLKNKIEANQDEIKNKLLKKIGELQQQRDNLKYQIYQLNNKINEQFNLMLLVSIVLSVMIMYLIVRLRFYKKEKEELEKKVAELLESPIDNLISNEKMWKSKNNKNEE